MNHESNHLRLFLIRHGEIERPDEHRLYGHTDVQLSDRGRQQSAWIAETLSHLAIDAVYSSDLSRAEYAAKLIASRHGCSHTRLASLREIDMGQWEGRSIKDINETSPELVASVYQNPYDFTYPGGESFRDFENRIVTTLEQIRTSHANGEIAIVAHGGVCRMILGQVLGIPANNWLRIAQNYGCINIIEWFGESPIVRMMNYIGALQN